MRKLKPLRPTLREKKRYLAFEIIGKEQQADPWLTDKLTAVLGAFGAAKAGVQAVEFNAKTQRGLLRVSAKGVDAVKASFLFLDSGFIVRSLGVSGMLKKARSLLET